MKKNSERKAARHVSLAVGLSAGLVVLMLFGVPALTQADLVQMQNGDRYTGKVISLSGDTLVLQSDVAGTLRLPRSRVAQLTLGTNAVSAAGAVAVVTNRPPPVAAGAQTNLAPSEMPGVLRQLGAHTNLIQRVQAQFLSDAGPEANAKFNELLNGLMSGQLSMNDLRAQAQSAANQLRDARKELGDDAGIMIDGYLAILDHFLKETPPPPNASTNLNRPMLNAKPGAPGGD